jgi:hypothetical protein
VFLILSAENKGFSGVPDLNFQPLERGFAQKPNKIKAQS